MKGAMFAVGNTAVLAITQDTKQAWRLTGFSLSGPTWSQVGYNTSAVYAGGIDVGTGYDGLPYQFLPGKTAPASLSRLGQAPGDQFDVAESGRLYALVWDHSNIVSYLESSGWTSHGASASEIFVGGPDGVAATALDPTKKIYFQTGGAWIWQGWPAPSFVVTGATGLAATWWDGAVLLSNDTAVSGVNWTGIGKSQLPAKIVGHGDKLYATLDPILAPF
jgi:hypothetical protein